MMDPSLPLWHAMAHHTGLESAWSTFVTATIFATNHISGPADQIGRLTSVTPVPQLVPHGSYPSVTVLEWASKASAFERAVPTTVTITQAPVIVPYGSSSDYDASIILGLLFLIILVIPLFCRYLLFKRYKLGLEEASIETTTAYGIISERDAEIERLSGSISDKDDEILRLQRQLLDHANTPPAKGPRQRSASGTMLPPQPLGPTSPLDSPGSEDTPALPPDDHEDESSDESEDESGPTDTTPEPELPQSGSTPSDAPTSTSGEAAEGSEESAAPTTASPEQAPTDLEPTLSFAPLSPATTPETELEESLLAPLVSPILSPATPLSAPLPTSPLASAEIDLEEPTVPTFALPGLSAVESDPAPASASPVASPESGPSEADSLTASSFRLEPLDLTPLPPSTVVAAEETTPKPAAPVTDLPGLAPTSEAEQTPTTALTSPAAATENEVLVPATPPAASPAPVPAEIEQTSNGPQTSTAPPARPIKAIGGQFRRRNVQRKTSLPKVHEQVAAEAPESPKPEADGSADEERRVGNENKPAPQGRPIKAIGRQFRRRGVQPEASLPKVHEQAATEASESPKSEVDGSADLETHGGNDNEQPSAPKDDAATPKKPTGAYGGTMADSIWSVKESSNDSDASKPPTPSTTPAFGSKPNGMMASKYANPSYSTTSEASKPSSPPKRTGANGGTMRDSIHAPQSNSAGSQEQSTTLDESRSGALFRRDTSGPPANAPKGPRSMEVRRDLQPKHGVVKNGVLASKSSIVDDYPLPPQHKLYSGQGQVGLTQPQPQPQPRPLNANATVFSPGASTITSQASGQQQKQQQPVSASAITSATPAPAVMEFGKLSIMEQMDDREWSSLSGPVAFKANIINVPQLPTSPAPQATPESYTLNIAPASARQTVAQAAVEQTEATAKTENAADDRDAEDAEDEKAFDEMYQAVVEQSEATARTEDAVSDRDAMSAEDERIFAETYGLDIDAEL